MQVKFLHLILWVRKQTDFAANSLPPMSLQLKKKWSSFETIEYSHGVVEVPNISPPSFVLPDNLLVIVACHDKTDINDLQ